MSALSVVKECAIKIILRARTEDAQNAEAVLRDSFKDAGRSALEAEELAERWLSRLQEQIQAVCQEWLSVGLPPPVATEDSKVVISAIHSNYRAVVRHPGLPLHFWDAWDYVRAFGSHELLASCCVYLALVGGETVFCTDGPNDAGVDCIARIGAHGLRGLCVAVQSKSTSNSHIDKNTIMLDVSKFLDGESVVAEYLRALNTTESREGVGLVYVFVTNKEFEEAAQQYASRKRIMLRCGRQLAYVLSLRFTPFELRELLGRIVPELKRNLSRNLVTLIDAPAPTG